MAIAFSSPIPFFSRSRPLVGALSPPVPTRFQPSSSKSLTWTMSNRADELFFEKVAKNYDSIPVETEELYEDTLSRTRKHLSPTSRVLEVGCGTGTTALRLAPDVSQIYGTDSAPTMVKIASEKAKSESIPNVEFAVSTVQELGKSQTGFDAVLAFNVLHLLNDLPSALLSIQQTLKPGGVFISKTFKLRGNILYKLLASTLQLFRMMPHMNFFSGEELCDYIENAGFRIIETHDYAEVPPRRFVVAQKK